MRLGNVDWGLYNTRLYADGETDKERLVNQYKSSVLRSTNPLTYKSVLIDGENTHVFISNTNYDNVKKFQNFTDFIISVGSSVLYSNTYWIVTSINPEADLCVSGTITQCNYLFKFQNSSSDILSYWGVINSSRSSDTLDQRNIITTSENKLIITLPYNDNTKKIHLDKRLIIGSEYDKSGIQIPKVYKVINAISEDSDYSNGRLLTVTVEACVSNINDSLKEMVADYIQPINVNSGILKSEIIGSQTIKIGGSTKTYKVNFYDASGELVSDVLGVWEWSLPIGYEDSFICTPNDNSITIKALDFKEMIGKKIVLKVKDENELYLSEFTVEVVGLF